MSEWAYSTLGVECDLYQPKTISRKELKPTGEYPVYGANGQIGRYDKFNHEESQVLLSCRGNCGTINVSEEFSWINGNAMVCKPKSERLRKDFLAYYLQSVDWTPIITGTAQPQITREPLARVLVPVPPFEEQKRIVETLDGHLSKIDKAISDLDYADSQALLFRRSILNTLLNPQLSGSEPGIESITRQLDWTTVQLSKLVDVLDNKRIPLSASQRKHREGSVPYYGATGQVGTIDEHLFDEPLVLLGEDGVQFFDANKPKAYKIEGPSWVNNHAHVLRPRAGLIEFGYLLHFLNNFDYRGYANGTTRLKLTQGAMNSIPIHLPPLEEQKRIVATIDDHLSRLDSTRKSISSQKYLLANLRRSILNATFTAQSNKEN